MSVSSQKASNNNARSELQFKIARSKHELLAAFRLVYRSYSRSGLVAENPSRMRLTPFHMLPESEVLVAKLRGTVFTTISLFVDGEYGLPMESMYPREISTLRERGLRIAEVGSLADRRSSQFRFIETLAILGRLLAQSAVYRNVDTLVAVVHPRHAKLYKRLLGFKQIGDHTSCPYANGNLAEAMYLRFADYDGTNFLDRFFNDPIAPRELEVFNWSEHLKCYFQKILDADGKIAKIVGIKNYLDWKIEGQPTSASIGLDHTSNPAGSGPASV